jgi:hypothetical protein
MREAPAAWILSTIDPLLIWATQPVARARTSGPDRRGEEEMTRILPVILLTIFAGYVVWTDATSVEPVSTIGWVIDAVTVALAAWSWISFLRRKRDVG